MSSQALCIALTGGIGSGKTTVSDIFAELGVPVIDADVISRQLTEKDGAAFEPVVELFGNSILTDSGEIDRSSLRKLVFENPELRLQLEAIIHPLVRKQINQRINELRQGYCLVSIPLLLETGKPQHIDRILVVDCPEHLQIQRASKRDQSNQTDIQKIITSQVDRQTRLNSADDVIYNDKDLEYLRQQVSSVHERYLKLSRESNKNDS